MASVESITKAVANRIAAQWVALGAQIEGIDDQTPIDIEALVAITADQRTVEARVYEAAVDWCVSHGRMVHLGRLRNVARELEVGAPALQAFAGDVAGSGGHRWPFAAPRPPTRPRRKTIVHDLSAPGRIVWRVRSAFGVNARSDVLAVLLTTPPVPVSLSDLTRRTRFTKKNVSIAVADMSLAGIVTKTRVGREDRVALDRSSPLRDLLEPEGVPSVDWTSRWRIVRQVASVDEATKAAANSVRLVETRVVAEAASADLDAAALPRPDLTARGSAWGPAFQEWRDGIVTVLGLMGA
jgi:hypothetical protein